MKKFYGVFIVCLALNFLAAAEYSSILWPSNALPVDETISTTKAAKYTQAYQAEPFAGDKRINLNLKNADLGQVLKLFAQQGNLNILADRSVQGQVSFAAKNIDILEALDMVLKINGYSWSKKGNNIIVSLKKPARTYILNYVDAATAKKTLQDLLPSAIGISIDERLNSVSVRGSLTDLAEADAVIADVDVPPLQVLVEARIVEVNAKDSPFLGAGLQYRNSRGNSNTEVDMVGLAQKRTAANATQGFFAMIAENNVEAWLEALQTNVHTDLLANTKIMATNNKPARIITGERLGYHVRQVNTTSTVEGVEFLDVGTQLVFTPRIAQDGFVTMKIKPEISEGSIINELPQKNTTEVETEVTVQDGQSIIIGGLIREKKTKTANGIPFLMDIPVLGSLFRSTSIVEEKKETIVVITPHIISKDSFYKVKYQEPKKVADGGLF